MSGPRKEVFKGGVKEILPNARPVRGSEKLGSDVEVDSVGMNKFCPKGGGNTTIEENLRNILTRMITRPTGGININSPMSQGGFSKEDMVKNQPKKELIGTFAREGPFSI